MAGEKLIVTPMDVEREILNAVWDEVIGPAIGVANKPIIEARESARVSGPETMLHFTTAQGAIAILESGRLRLTRAQASNDPMELKHGLGLAASLVKKRTNDLFTQMLLAGMKRGYFLGREHHIPDPHICCFCLPECQAEIPHWAVYGDGSLGFVLVFEGRALAKKELTDFFPVIYDDAQQRERLDKVLDIAADCFVRVGRAAEKRHSLNPEGLQGTAAHAFGSIVAMHAATMKKSEFSFEREWRLMRSALLGVTLPEKKPELTLGAAANGPILRTFYELPFDKSDLKAVIIGPQFYELNEPALRLALEEWGYENVEIRPGPIDLRISRHR